VGHFLAEAGLNLGLFRVFDHPLDTPAMGTEDDWKEFYQGYEYEVFLPKGKVTYYVSSESGKIDLNRSQPELLKLFLEYELGVGLNEHGEQNDQIDTITDSLADWKDSDDMHRLNGAESEYYKSLPDPYIARNGPIRDPAEFFLIKGTDILAGKFYAQEIFTVHNPGGKINFNSLTPAMLDFIVGGDQDKIDAYREAKQEYNGHIPQSIAAQIIGEERFALMQPYLAYDGGNNKYYFIVGTGYADVTQEDENRYQPSAGDGIPQQRKKYPGTIDSLLIEKSGGSYTRLAWQERYI